MLLSQQFADIILPLALPQLYTYAVPDELAEQVLVGGRVMVSVRNKLYTGIVHSLHHNKPEGYQTKPIEAVMDTETIVNSRQLQFWEWVAAYYMCTLGEVYKAAVPTGLKPESETKISVNEHFDEETEEVKLSAAESAVVDELKSTPHKTIKEIKALPQGQKLLQVIKQLLAKNLICVDEQLKTGYKPKYETYVKLHELQYNEKTLHATFNSLKAAPRQLQLLMTFIQMSNCLSEAHEKEVTKNDLLERTNISAATLKSMVEKQILETYNKEIGRLTFNNPDTNDAAHLNPAQVVALNEVNKCFETKNVVLLHGVTSSGKTEVYMHLIEECLASGRQVLFLLPEIAITPQIINRLRDVFGDKAGVYHSKFSDAERVEIWHNVAGNGIDHHPKYQLILGVRSSVFLPFENLGLIIVDEEHENTYKQFDPAPRYHARDSAIMLGHLHSARVLLGTATPALETYYNAEAGKYGLVQLTERYKNIEMPEILVANVRLARKQKTMKSHFSPLLVANIEEALRNKEQVILFQNRRGFSPFVECNTCGWVAKCEHCDVSLTYHKGGNQLVCHYCGYTISNQPLCMACGDAAMQTRGFGTEKIEDEIPLFFPDAIVGRMDMDTTRSKNAYQQIISDFESHKMDILIGTQMITKGLDFGNVSVVGILNADTMLNFPDFRAYERSFQLMVQVSGRAGRKHKRGKVIIQTTDPEHPVIQYVVNNDFRSLYVSQMNERKDFHYPPFHRLILLSVKHKQQAVLDIAAEQLAHLLRTIFAHRVLGPEYPPVNRVQNWYQKNIMIKIEREKSVQKAKQILTKSILRLKAAHPSIQIVVNIDPA